MLIGGSWCTGPLVVGWACAFSAFLQTQGNACSHFGRLWVAMTSNFHYVSLSFTSPWLGIPQLHVGTALHIQCLAARRRFWTCQFAGDVQVLGWKVSFSQGRLQYWAQHTFGFLNLHPWVYRWGVFEWWGLWCGFGELCAIAWYGGISTLSAPILRTQLFWLAVHHTSLTRSHHKWTHIWHHQIFLR